MKEPDAGRLLGGCWAVLFVAAVVLAVVLAVAFRPPFDRQPAGPPCRCAAKTAPCPGACCRDEAACPCQHEGAGRCGKPGCCCLLEGRP